MTTLTVVDTTVWIRESCDMQNATTPEDYIGMARAYEYAVWRMSADPNRPRGHIYHSDLAALICNVCNANWVEYRDFPAVFANGRIAKQTGREIHRALQDLLAAQDRVTPEEFYFYFEEIHPWDDGNGRVGTILFNYLKNKIMTPVHPPENPNW